MLMEILDENIFIKNQDWEEMTINSRLSKYSKKVF